MGTGEHSHGLPVGFKVHTLLLQLGGLGLGALWQVPPGRPCISMPGWVCSNLSSDDVIRGSKPNFCAKKDKRECK